MKIDSPNSPIEHWKRAVLNAGLADSATKTWLSAASPLDDIGWHELCQWAREQRVLGLLRLLCSEAPITDPQRQALTSAWHVSAVSTMLVEASLPSVADALNAAEIDWRILKGVATSRMVYAEPGLRSFGDIDILVRPDDLQRTLVALGPITATGATPLHGPFRSQALQERQVTDLRGIELDIHRAVEGSLVTSRLPVETFFERPQELIVNGRTLLAPSTEVSFVHAVMHYSSAGRRMSTIPDIARLIIGVDPEDAVLARMLGTRTTKFLFHWALSEAGNWTELPDDWKSYLAWRRPPMIARRPLAWVQAKPDRSSAINFLLGGNRLRRAAETLWPTKEFLEYTGTNRWGHIRRLFAKGSNL